MWDQNSFTNIVNLDNTLSFKEHINDVGPHFSRNAEIESGILVKDLYAPTIETTEIQTILVYVDPLTHPTRPDILPDPSAGPCAIWINGERIEYKIKSYVDNNTWELSELVRGSQGTAPNDHLAMISSLADPLVMVPNPVWVENENVLDYIIRTGISDVTWDAQGWDTVIWDKDVYVGGKYDMSTFDSAGWDNGIIDITYTEKISVDSQVWNAQDPIPDPASGVNGWDQVSFETGTWEVSGIYTSVTSAVPLWYAVTEEAKFLQEKPGISIP